jgi:GNAT superfamily N-acetyltransferase
MFADLALSRRLERAEGHAAARFAQARSRLNPERGSAAVQYGGADVVFDGPESPVTQTFGLGLFQEATAGVFDWIERFFFARGAHADHEVSPFAGTATVGALCDRAYRPIEMSSVMYRGVEHGGEAGPEDVRVRTIGPSEHALWVKINAEGWSHDHPEFRAFLEDTMPVLAAREDAACFLAEFDGQPAAAGALSLHEGVALFAGAATLPQFRRRGLQQALLAERLRFARDQGCELAMMVAEVGSGSQRNAERQGFRVAYTRTKWRLSRSIEG